MIDPDLDLENYNYNLPEELIAQRPNPIGRSHSKLLVYIKSENRIVHDSFSRINDYLPKNSTLVFNNSKVYPSRLIGTKKTGGKAEIFILDLFSDNEFIKNCLIKCRGKKSIGDQFLLQENQAVIVRIGDDGSFDLKFSSKMDHDYLLSHGKIPIPPYIRGGESDEKDKSDYQTIYAKNTGSVAAPTAGLHFTPELLDELKNSGHQDLYVTLHVGIGTFRPLSSKNLLEHKMHSETFFLDSANLSKISKECKNIIPVGTTSLRVLESIKEMLKNGDVESSKNYSTSIFLHPKNPPTSVSGLITNFHLPKSSLLILVSSLIGREKALEIYQEAVENKYRFFSYGDAMLILL
jgi:S-adenosylmethionine:tRNA ribosyltransferase-isomerase